MRIGDWSSDMCTADPPDAGERRKFVKHALDLDRGYGCALKRGEKHAPQGVAQRQAQATLQRLGDEGRLALAVAALQFKAVGLLLFLPVDRKRVVEGQGVAVSVVLVGGRFLKKKNKKQLT